MTFFSGWTICCRYILCYYYCCFLFHAHRAFYLLWLTLKICCCCVSFFFYLFSLSLKLCSVLYCNTDIGCAFDCMMSCQGINVCKKTGSLFSNHIFYSPLCMLLPFTFTLTRGYLLLAQFFLLSLLFVVIENMHCEFYDFWIMPRTIIESVFMSVAVVHFAPIAQMDGTQHTNISQHLDLFIVPFAIVGFTTQFTMNVLCLCSIFTIACVVFTAYRHNINCSPMMFMWHTQPKLVHN